MSRYCKVCGVEIDPRRIAILPDTQTCTQHSTAEKKVAMVVQMGEGDHTWTETYAVDREVYDKIQEAEKNFRKTTNPKPKIKPIRHQKTQKNGVINHYHLCGRLLCHSARAPHQDQQNGFRFIDSCDFCPNIA